MTRHHTPLVRVGSQGIGQGEPLFVIAEIGLNHGGSVERALSLVDAAAAAGASAVKLQTLSADGLVASDAPAPAHVRAASLREFFAAFELNEAAHHRIAARARTHGLALVATPLYEEAVPLLDRVGVDAYKIASGDITWDRLIQRCASTRKPLIISTGMATLDEAAYALARARLGGASGVALMHCVSAYPVPRGSENLRAIETLAQAFPVPVGLSDHGRDGFALPLAVSMGASLYERHLVLAANDGSIDADVSSTPAELAELIAIAGRASDALGTGEKICGPIEEVNRTASRRALFAARALSSGHVIHHDDITALRSATGLRANRQHELAGTRLSRDVAAGTPFFESDVIGASLQVGCDVA